MSIGSGGWSGRRASCPGKFLNFIIGEVVRHHRAIADRTHEASAEPAEPAGPTAG
ncbi:hypothetical protein [Streptomyces sp. Isolate_219]|uniref:hypothetical protein n=1 Tax=Streptomyces sp. Isolate_219 TaxID=2950110 RepID=UPI0021C8DD61|nr:hypothetical protein [Streptomyces sp. Isolate_219]MCR8574654.1 hypothetical protein [Streptomyces sp. Isolate_219]